MGVILFMLCDKANRTGKSVKHWNVSPVLLLCITYTYSLMFIIIPVMVENHQVQPTWVFFGQQRLKSVHNAPRSNNFEGTSNNCRLLGWNELRYKFSVYIMGFSPVDFCTSLQGVTQPGTCNSCFDAQLLSACAAFDHMVVFANKWLIEMARNSWG